jgi:anti-anti-sigma factor
LSSGRCHEAETAWTTPHGAADTVLTLPTGLLIGFTEEVLVTDTDAFPPGAEAEAWMPPGVEVRYASPRSADFAAIVSLYGEHDLDSHDTIAQALEPIDGDVLVDLTDCRFIDSSAVNAILAKSQQLQHRGHRLELVAPTYNVHVARIVEVVGLRTFLTVHERSPLAARTHAPTVMA